MRILKEDRLVYHLYGLTYDERLRVGERSSGMVLIIDPTPPFTQKEYEKNV